MKRFMIAVMALLLTVPAFAGPDSLKGLKTAKFVVDLNQGKGNVLKTRLSLIMETMDNIKEEGVKPVVVVAVRGPASRFMTVSNGYIAPEDEAIKAEISALTDELAARGVKLEQCAVALRMLDISPSDVQSEFTVVKNGYVSLIGYQNQGYALLPME